MNSLNLWPSIINAVKDPIALASLAILCLTFVLRIILSKIKTLRGLPAYNTIKYSITIVGFLVFLIVIGALALSFYKVYTTPNYKIIRLTSLEAVNILQKHRGNIERCVKDLTWCLYLDFLFTTHLETGINVDIYTNSVAGSEAWDPAHPQWQIPLEFKVKGQKLSASYPDVNKCLIEIIKNDIDNFTLSGVSPFTHRIITDKGIKWVKAFQKYDRGIQLKSKADESILSEISKNDPYYKSNSTADGDRSSD